HSPRDLRSDPLPARRDERGGLERPLQHVPMRGGAAAALLVALAACGAPPPNLSTEEDPLTVCARGATTKGIDVSHYQGTIDWAAVNDGGIGFAFMKATEGLTFVDSTFAANWSGAKAHGVVRGAYHFFRPQDDGIQQADFFLSK